MSDFYVDANNNNLGYHDVAPKGATKVPDPDDGTDVWGGTKWMPSPGKWKRQRARLYETANLNEERFIDALMQRELDGDPTALNQYKADRLAVRALASFPVKPVGVVYGDG